MPGQLKGIHLIVSGVVQGVGFRWYVERVANNLGLVGYVRNLYDGSVETYAEGEEDALNAFYKEMKIGPRSAHVADVKMNWKEYTGDFKDFRIEL
jgi:acylphosphatase